MIFKNKLDETQFKILGLDENIIKKRLLAARTHVKDRKKSRDAKNNWRRNKHKIKKGMKKWAKSTSGKRFHRSLGRFNALREKVEHVDNMVVLDQDMVTLALLSLSTIETHLLLELKYYEPDFTQLSDYYNIVDNFFEDSKVIRSELIDSYASGKISNESFEILTNIVQNFLDPVVYMNTLTNESEKSGYLKEVNLQTLNKIIDKNENINEMYNEIENTFV